jgi:TonB family protein
MTSKNNTYQLFGPSGCLTLETMKRCRFNTLTPQELKPVEEHLVMCEFCSDAMEGVELVSDKNKLESIVTEINGKLRKEMENKTRFRNRGYIFVSNRILYFAIAASVIILIGLYSYFQFIVTNPKQPDLVSETYQIVEIPIPKNEKDIIIENEVENEEATIFESPKKESTEVLITTKDKITSSNKESLSGKGDHYQPSPDQMKSADTGTEGFYTNDKIPEEIQISESIDIASTQPVEYYLTGITISEKAVVNMDIAQPASKQEEEPAVNGISLKSAQGAMGENRSKGKIMQSVDSHSEQVHAESEEREKHVEQMSNDIHFFDAFGQKPEFPGGEESLIKYLQENLKYPAQAKKQGIQGNVLISFMVEENGKVSTVQILHGIGGGCDEEAVRVISGMPSWKPAEKEGKNERVLFKMPVTFRLY